jgi:hypothetical protein
VSVFAIEAALAAIAAVFAIATWARRCEAVQLPQSRILRAATTSRVSVVAELARRELP